MFISIKSIELAVSDSKSSCDYIRFLTNALLVPARQQLLLHPRSPGSRFAVVKLKTSRLHKLSKESASSFAIQCTKENQSLLLSLSSQSIITTRLPTFLHNYVTIGIGPMKTKLCSLQFCAYSSWELTFVLLEGLSQ